MSNYRNFVSDFPGRCDTLLARFDREAGRGGLDVTLMLCIAMPSIVVPVERLAGPSDTGDQPNPGHPSRDWHRFEEAKARLDRLFEGSFRGSELCPVTASSSWSFGELSNPADDPDSWPELSALKPLGRDKKSRTVLLHLRNALAHGNIFTRGTPQIDQIIFLSKPNEATRFRYLAVTPVEFRGFLNNWLRFVRQLEVPEGVIPDNAQQVAHVA